MRTSVLAVACLLLTGGCNPTFAPPVRAVMHGAPGRLQQGGLELGATAGGVFIPDTGGPHVAVGVTDWLSLEGGGNFRLAADDNERWLLGFGGARVSFAPHRERRVHLVADLELGAGAGLGGSLDGNQLPSSECPYCDGRTAPDRRAWGAYQGAGLGVRIRWLTVFGRVRLEESVATNVPLTLWPSASVGLEFRVRDWIALSTLAGFMAYTNARDSEQGFFWQLGVVFFLDGRGVRATLPAAEPWAPRPPLSPLPPPASPPPLDPDDCG